MEADNPLPSFPPHPTPEAAQQALDAFWSEVREAMERHHIPHLAAIVSVGAFPKLKTPGQGKDHKHELQVMTSVSCVGNDNQIQGYLAAVLLRTVIDAQHEDIERHYQELVCGVPKGKKQSKRGRR